MNDTIVNLLIIRTNTKTQKQLLHETILQERNPQVLRTLNKLSELIVEIEVRVAMELQNLGANDVHVIPAPEDEPDTHWTDHVRTTIKDLLPKK